MQAVATITTNQREQSEQARVRALVRFNGLTFHSIAMASFLETAVPLQVNRLAQVFGAHPDASLWLEQIWWPQRAELGRQLREYIEATWPEFDWSAAYQEFCEPYRPRSGLEKRDSGAALEALALCVTAAQAAMFYRALANSADEPALRALARNAACGHAGHFDYFRALFERCKRSGRVGFAATWRTVIAVSRCAREHDVASAFQALGQNWSRAPVVPALGFPEYRERMARLIQRHAAPGTVERMLFRPWLARERAAPVLQTPAARRDRWLPAAQPA
ncbi:MAG TPA: hypothetical protein VFO57_07600 [Burkholderiales bacterium]|nr:hypothetical protein [Burkholderiales bacterium]